MASKLRIIIVLGLLVGAIGLPSGSSLAAIPPYTITDVGPISQNSDCANLNAADAVGINDAGQIVGTMYIESFDAQGHSMGCTQHAFSWTAGSGIVRLPDTIASWGNAINSTGKIVGGNYFSLPAYHPALWPDASGSAPTDLGGFQDSQQSIWALDVSDTGIVVGEGGTAGPYDYWHAFMWSAASGFQDLGVPTVSGVPLTQSRGRAVNSSGQVVGYASDSTNGNQIAVLWQIGQYTLIRGQQGVPQQT